MSQWLPWVVFSTYKTLLFMEIAWPNSFKANFDWMESLQFTTQLDDLEQVDVTPHGLVTEVLKVPSRATTPGNSVSCWKERNAWRKHPSRSGKLRAFRIYHPDSNVAKPSLLICMKVTVFAVPARPQHICSVGIVGYGVMVGPQQGQSPKLPYQ
jgi:hypothetical protein